MKEKLMSILEVLAEKLGTTTELLWSVLVKQAGVEAQIWMAWIIVWASIFSCVFVGSIIVGFIGRKQNWEMWGCWFIVTFFAVVIGVTSCVGCYSKLLTVAQNPQFWALNEILKTVQ